IIVHDEKPLTLDELVERSGLKRNDIARPRRDVVAPRLASIDRAWTAHPVVGRGAGEHQENMDRRWRDEPAEGAGLGGGFVTLRARGETVCALLDERETCFDLDRTDAGSFRGAISGLGLFSCQFTAQNEVPKLVESAPLSIKPGRAGRRR